MIRLFARHAGRHLPRPGSMLQPARFTDEPDDRLRTVRLQPVDEPEDDWGEPDDDDGRCVHCGAEIGHYNGCTEDPDAMCLCHLCMEDQAVTTEEDCPFHGSDAPHRPSWRERLARPLSRLIDATARGMAWLLDDDWDGGLDDRDIADPFGTQDLPRPGERGAPSHGVTSSAGKTAPRPGPGQPGLLRRFADWLAGLEDWDDDPEDGEKEPAQARGCMAELCRYWPGEGCMRGVMPCGEDGYVTDDTLTGTDIIDCGARLRGEAPVMAGHYDVPRPASAAAPERRELSGPGYPSAWDAPFPHGARLPDSGAPDTQVIATTRIGDIFLPLTGTEPDGPWPPLAGERVSGSLSDDTDIHNFRIPPGRAARNIWQPPARESAWDRYARCGVPDSLRYVQWILAAPLPQVKALTA